MPCVGLTLSLSAGDTIWSTPAAVGSFDLLIAGRITYVNEMCAPVSLVRWTFNCLIVVSCRPADGSCTPVSIRVIQRLQLIQQPIPYSLVLVE